MDYSIETAPIETLPCDCIIIGLYLNQHQNQQLATSGAGLSESLQKVIANMISRGDISGKVGETLLINVIPDSVVARMLLVGLGENKPLSPKNYRKALSAAVNTLKKTLYQSHCLWLGRGLR